MAVSQKPRKKKDKHRQSALMRAITKSVRTPIEDRPVINYVGVMKPLNEGHYTK